MTSIPKITQDMIVYSQGNLHDIHHFLRVWAYAKTIGELEALDEQTQLILETAAIVHDIACPLCRRLYGNTNARAQEREGMILAAEFLKDAGLTKAELERVIYLVGHHHTLSDICGLDHQILIEADYLANAAENHFPFQEIEAFCHQHFRTPSGTRLLRALFPSTTFSDNDL